MNQESQAQSTPLRDDSWIPCLYECTVNHTRIAPKKHAFDYRVFMLAIDLDNFPKLPLLSQNRFNLFS